jgi:hypothetical protein
MCNTNPLEESAVSPRQFWKRAGLVIAAAVVVNLAVYLVAKAAGVELLVPMGASPVPLEPAPVAVFTVVPLVLAAVLILVLRRVGVASPAVFAGVAAVALLLSLSAPLSADLAASNKLVLASMHTVAGLAALLGLTPLFRRVRVGAPRSAGSASTGSASAGA